MPDAGNDGRNGTSAYRIARSRSEVTEVRYGFCATSRYLGISASASNRQASEITQVQAPPLRAMGHVTVGHASRPGCCFLGGIFAEVLLKPVRWRKFDEDPELSTAKCAGCFHFSKPHRHHRYFRACLMHLPPRNISCRLPTCKVVITILHSHDARWNLDGEGI